MPKKITTTSILFILIYVFFIITPLKTSAYAEVEIRIRDMAGNRVAPPTGWAFDYQQGDWGDFSGDGSDGWNWYLTPGGYRPYVQAISGYNGPYYDPPA